MVMKFESQKIAVYTNALIVIFIPCLALESSPLLPAPKNVMVYSYNFRSSLRWSPVEVDEGLVLYTVHFKT